MILYVYFYVIMHNEKINFSRPICVKEGSIAKNVSNYGRGFPYSNFDTLKAICRARFPRPKKKEILKMKIANGILNWNLGKNDFKTRNIDRSARISDAYKFITSFSEQQRQVLKNCFVKVTTSGLKSRLLELR